MQPSSSAGWVRLLIVGILSAALIAGCSSGDDEREAKERAAAKAAAVQKEQRLSLQRAEKRGARLERARIKRIRARQARKRARLARIRRKREQTAQAARAQQQSAIPPQCRGIPTHSTAYNMCIGAAGSNAPTYHEPPISPPGFSPTKNGSCETDSGEDPDCPTPSTEGRGPGE